MLLPEVGGAAHVEECRAVAVEIVERRRSQAPARAASQGLQSHRPSPAQANAVGAGCHMPHRIGAIVSAGLPLWVIRPPEMVLDVPHLVAERLQATEPVQEHPGLSPVRAPAHVSKHNKTESRHDFSAARQANDASLICMRSIVWRTRGSQSAATSCVRSWRYMVS